MRIFETSDDIVDMISEIGSNTGLDNYGLNIRILSVDKQKDIIKVSKASSVTEYLTKKDSMIHIFVYEAAFDRLTEEYQKIIIEQALSNISVDLEKDRVNVESHPYPSLFAMRSKYGETALNAIESGYQAIKQIEQEEKDKKEQARMDKKFNRPSSEE